VTPVRLHERLQTVAFSDTPGHVVDVPQNVVDEISALLAPMMRTVTKHKRLEALSNIAQRALYVKSCVYNYLKDSSSTIWTKEHPRFYACQSCANTQRPCMVAVGSIVFVLPLHPALREPEDDEDEEMLDRLSVADPHVGVDLWIARRQIRTTSRKRNVYPQAADR
jgi:hypothetical protein